MKFHELTFSARDVYHFAVPHINGFTIIERFCVCVCVVILVASAFLWEVSFIFVIFLISCENLQVFPQKKRMPIHQYLTDIMSTCLLTKPITCKYSREWKKRDIETAELTQQRVHWLIDISVSLSADSAQHDGFLPICVQYFFMMLFINWKIIIWSHKEWEDTRILGLRKGGKCQNEHLKQKWQDYVIAIRTSSALFAPNKNPIVWVRLLTLFIGLMSLKY